MSEYPCTNCNLHKTCKTVKISHEGTGDILLLGEAPGSNEDEVGIPFVGESGQLLRTLVGQLEIDPKRIRYSNAVRCRPPKNKAPTDKQIKACAEHLIKELEEIPTNIIVPLGGTAVKALRNIGYLRVPGKIMNLHGVAIKEEETVILPMVHPSYILRNPNAVEMYVSSMNNLEEIVKNGFKEKADVSYDFSEDIAELKAAIDKATLAGAASYDIETSSLHPKEFPDSRMLCFSLSWKEKQAFCFYLTEDNREEAIRILHERFLQNEDVTKIIQHAKFELMWSMSLGYTIENMMDTMLMHWHVEEKNGTHGLSKLSLVYTDMGFYDAELENYKKEHKEANPDKTYTDPKTKEVKKGTYANLPLEILLPYNCADTDSTLRIYNRLKPLLNEKQQKLLETIQIPSCYPLAEMELKGVSIDWEYVEKLNKEMPERIARIEQELLDFPRIKEYREVREKAGKTELNFNSSMQLAEILFDYMGFEPVYNTETGRPSTDKNVLAYLEEKYNSVFIRLIRERREVSTLYNTFVKGPLAVRRGDRIYTSYGMAHTETGRLNSKNPNLQNIPRGPLIKRMYIPDKDQILVQADYSQVELRVMAIFSKDKNLLSYFKEGVDVHRMVASRIYRKEPEDISSEERTRAKRTVFGLCYGQGPQGLSEELRISKEEAKDFLEKFFAEFPAVERWIKKTQDSANKIGQVETMFGRIRRLPDAMNEDEYNGYRLRAMRQAINQPIQGTAADILFRNMGQLWGIIKEENLKTRMMLTVYDSLNFSVVPEEINYFLPMAKIVLESFSDIDWISIPILCDFEIGYNWAEMVEIDDRHIDMLASGVSLENVINTVIEEQEA